MIVATLVYMTRFENIGKALRLLREKKGKSQKELALAAGITSAMLSNYETGEKKPSLDSLGKIIEALDLHLGKFDDALDVVNDRPLRSQQFGYAANPAPGQAMGVDVKSFIGVEEDLPPDLEQGFAEMIHGFRQISRYMYRTAIRTGRGLP
ncbi:MAG: helix-turn-helix transcriptional regulator [Acidobacteriota bacterium]